MNADFDALPNTSQIADTLRDAAKGNGPDAANDQPAKIPAKRTNYFSDPDCRTQPCQTVKDKLEAAVDLLRCQPMVGRALRREAYPFEPDGFLVSADEDDSVTAIEGFDDHEACYYFLKWLTQRHKEFNAAQMAWKRRSRFVLVQGGVQ